MKATSILFVIYIFLNMYTFSFFSYETFTKIFKSCTKIPPLLQNWKLKYCNRQKSSLNKSFRKLSPKFKKVLCIKGPWNKKSQEIKSCQFETLFSRTFFSFEYDFIQKKSSEKKSSYIEKCMGTNDVYKHWKNGL